MTDEAPPTLTEAAVTTLLRERYTASGNGGGGQWAFMPQVRNAAGFDASRTFDAVVLDLWPSRGLVLHVLEIKTSRSDWLRELKEPAKAEAACAVAEHFSIVAPKGVVKAGELPPTWGLIEIHGTGTQEDPWRLRTKTAAPFLLEPGYHGQKNRGPISRGLVVSMLRSIPGAVPGGRLPSASEEEIRQARSSAYGEGYDRGRKDEAQTRNLSAQDLDHWRAFQGVLQAAGLSRHQSSPHGLMDHAPDIAAIVQGGQVDRNLQGVRDHLARTVALLDQAMGVPT